MRDAAAGVDTPRPLRLVLLPGLDATGTQHVAFTAAMAGLGVVVTVIAYPVDRALDYAALADVVRQALPTDSDYVLLGESFSGPLALVIAAASPPRLRGLVLSTTFARSPWLALRRLQALLYRAPVRALPMPALSWLLLGRWSSPALRTALQAALARVRPAVLRTRAVAALGVDVTVQARAVHVPALCLHAAHDRLLPTRSQRHLSALLPAQATFRLDGPHLLLQACPEAAASVIAGFMRGVCDTGCGGGAPYDPGGRRYRRAGVIGVWRSCPRRLRLWLSGISRCGVQPADVGCIRSARAGEPVE